MSHSAFKHSLAVSLVALVVSACVVLHATMQSARAAPPVDGARYSQAPAQAGAVPPQFAAVQAPFGPNGQPSGVFPQTGAPNVSAAYPYSGGGPAAPARSALRPIEGGQIVARVGKDVVLAGEALWMANLAIEANRDKIAERDAPKVREMFLRRQLPALVETKLLYLQALNEIPEEGIDQVHEQLGNAFDEQGIQRLFDQMEVETRAALEARLRQLGTSLEAQKQAFVEKQLAGQWLRRSVNLDREISHDEMRDYYFANLKDFDFEATARWEEIMVRFNKYPNREAARQAIIALGNMVKVRGAPLAEVAKAHSDGFTARDGGWNNWTTRGSLAAKNLNHALFTLPVGELSQIIESPRGFHITRVVERRDAGRTPFVEAQVEIREKLKKKHRQGKIKDFIVSLKEKTPVWTIFDDGQKSPQIGGRDHADRRR